MQSEPTSDPLAHDHLHHHGTISSDGTLSLDDSGLISDFNGLYPYPQFGPTLDATLPVTPKETTSDADADGNASGSGVTTETESSPSGLVIIANYDSSIANLATSAPSEFTAVTGAINAAIDFYEAAFTNPITLTIDFGISDLGNGVLADSMSQGTLVAYSTLRNALEGPVIAAGGSALPANEPFTNSVWYVSDAEGLALGLTAPGAIDGDVELSSTANFTYDPDSRAVSGEYDAIGALEHEISEVMGRVAYYPGVDGAHSYSPLDLFRYTAPGSIASNAGSAYFTTDGGTTDLAAFNSYTANGGDAGDWAGSVADDLYDAFSASGVANTVSSTDLTEMSMLGYTLAPTCYVAGTRILTDQGEVRIEDLAAGDHVHTRFAGTVPIKWIGHRRIDCRRHPDPREVLPVRIVAGAFAPGEPCRDLFLSPDHAVAVGDVLVPVRLLINGASIRQDTAFSQVQYFHIELQQHDLLLADGLLAESYLDTGNRGTFANADVPLVLHPKPDDASAQQQREAMSCSPLCCGRSDVEPLWRMLATRAEALGMVLPVTATTEDPDLYIVAGARRFAPAARDGSRYMFVLPALPDGARLHSRAAVPSDLRPWEEDRRRLGVMVRRIAVRSGDCLREVALDDPSLTGGWWAVERCDGTIVRWTDGDAELLPTHDISIVDVWVAGVLPYPIAEPMTRQANMTSAADAA